MSLLERIKNFLEKIFELESEAWEEKRKLYKED